MAALEVFVSYAHADRNRVLEVRDALVAKGLGVWLDDAQIETFASISVASSCSRLLRSSKLASWPCR